MVKQAIVLGFILAGHGVFAQSSGFALDNVTLPSQSTPNPIVPPPSRPTPAVPAPRPAIINPTGTAVTPAAPVAPKVVATPVPPPAPSAMDQFNCDDGKSTNLTEQATQLFKDALGVDGMRAGRYLNEGEGFGGNQVSMKIMNTPTINLKIVSHGADVAGSACWRERAGRKQVVLSVVVSNASMGNGRYQIHVSRQSRNSVFLRGTGQLQSVLNHHFDLANSPAAR